MCEFTLLHFLLYLNYIHCFNLTVNSSGFRPFIGNLSAIQVVYRQFNGNNGRLSAVSIFYRTFIGHTGHLTDISDKIHSLYLCNQCAFCAIIVQWRF